MNVARPVDYARQPLACVLTRWRGEVRATFAVVHGGGAFLGKCPRICNGITLTVADDPGTARLWPSRGAGRAYRCHWGSKANVPCSQDESSPGGTLSFS